MTDLDTLSGSYDYELAYDECADKFFEKLLYNALKEQASTNRYSIECKAAIIDQLAEFLSCFILIGFDLNGDPIEITKSKTPQEGDALGMRLQKFAPKYLTRHLRVEDDIT